jgi:hypothetical protein
MPFSNPVVGGIALVRAAIRSPNYVAGMAGWTINKDGSAEFNSVVIRGNLIVVGAHGSIETQVTSGNPTLYFYNAAKSNWGFINLYSNTGSDAGLGINSGSYVSTITGNPTLRPRLIFSDGDTFQETVLSHVDPTQTNIGGTLIITDNTMVLGVTDHTGLNMGAMVIGSDGKIQFKVTLNQINPVSWDPTTKWLEVDTQGWQDILLNNGWSNKSLYDTAQMKMTPHGNVIFKGTITGGTTTDGTQWGQIPTNQMQPVNHSKLMHPVVVGGGTVNARVYINGATRPDLIYIYGCAGAVDIGLEGLSYSVPHL